MGYLRRILGVTLRDKEHRSEIHKVRAVKPLIPIERLYKFSHVFGMPQER